MIAAGTPAYWIKLISGLALVYSLFDLLASALGSDRGQAGHLVTAAVLAALVAVERLLFGQSAIASMRSLGLGPPTVRSITIAMGLCAALIAVIPAYATPRGSTLAAYPGWQWLLPGLFAQAGIAEEALFRGYLFNRLRHGRSFWRAAALATGPFVLVHLILFATMPWPVAIAAVLLSIVLSFPLAYLFELGGNTIWAPALLHFTVQGTIKIVDIPGDTMLPLVWMAASAVIPYLAFLSRRSHVA
jgi:membrane protease YdiL (CAAX protease family)